MTTKPLNPADLAAIRGRWEKANPDTKSEPAYCVRQAVFMLSAHSDIAALLGEVERLKGECSATNTLLQARCDELKRAWESINELNKRLAERKEP